MEHENFWIVPKDNSSNNTHLCTTRYRVVKAYFDFARVKIYSFVCRQTETCWHCLVIVSSLLVLIVFFHRGALWVWQFFLCGKEDSGKFHNSLVLWMKSVVSLAKLCYLCSFSDSCCQAWEFKTYENNCTYSAMACRNSEKWINIHCDPGIRTNTVTGTHDSPSVLTHLSALSK